MTKSYFKLEEQYCPCCKTGKFAPELEAKINLAREIAGIPFVVTSGFRCEKHNKEIGGSANSSHLVGCAVDISTPDNYTRFKVLEGIMKAGFNRIGIAEKYVHCDIDDFSKPSPIIYLYKK